MLRYHHTMKRYSRCHSGCMRMQRLSRVMPKACRVY
jgi:hypothetical protein